MSGKNRAFALAVATAALVGLSAPVAGAATFSGPNGFNNDSLLNVSGNQVPLQACNNEIPVNVLGVQVPVDRIAAAIGLLSTEPAAAAQNSGCKQGAVSHTQHAGGEEEDAPAGDTQGPVKYWA